MRIFQGMRTPRYACIESESSYEYESSDDEVQQEGKSKLCPDLTKVKLNLFCVTAVLWLLVAIHLVKVLPFKDLHGGVAAGLITLYFIFMIGQSLAQTLQQIWRVLQGVVLAWLNICLVDALLSNSAVSSIGDSVLVWADYIIALLVILYLKIGAPTQLIALHYTTTMSMALLNPNSDINYVEQGLKVVKLACVGAVFAILAVVVAYTPRLLTFQCRDELYQMCEDITAHSMVKHECCYHAAGGPCRKQWRKDILEMQKRIAKFNSKLNDVWWEGFDCGYLGEKRDMMARLSGLYQSLSDIMLNIDASMSCGFLDGRRRMETMNVIDDLCQRLLTFTGMLLKSTAQVVMEWPVSEDTLDMNAKSIHHQQELVRLTLLELTSKAKSLHKPCGADMLQQQLEERFYVWALAWYANTVVDGATAMMSNQPASRTSLLQAMQTALLSAKPTSQHIDYVLWNTSKILVAFIVGRYWTHLNGTGFNAGIAMNVGWMLELTAGSSFKKDFQRLLGITFPYTFGGVVYVINFQCTSYYYWMSILTFFIVEVVCLRVIFGQSEYVFVAFLSGLFIGFPVLKDCNNDTSISSVEAAMFKEIQDCVLAIILVTSMNAIAVGFEKWVGHVPGTVATPSGLLQGLMTSTFDKTTRGLVRYFNAEESFAEGTDELRGQIATMSALNVDASGEPRLFQKSWPCAVVDDVLLSVESLRLCLVTLGRLGVMDIKNNGLPEMKVFDAGLQDTLENAQFLLGRLEDRQFQSNAREMLGKRLNMKHQECEVALQIMSRMACASPRMSMAGSVDADPNFRCAVLLCMLQQLTSCVGEICEDLSVLC